MKRLRIFSVLFMSMAVLIMAASSRNAAWQRAKMEKETSGIHE